MEIYADYEFYIKCYLSGRDPKIPNTDFPYWAMMASFRIREYTFGNADNADEFNESIQMCCCELAEKLYSVESMKGEDGMILQSYGNDGETGTYKVDDLTDSGIEKEVSRIIRRWLSNTGLLYCGVM